VLLDGVKHMVMTTGTPPTPDRGAKVLCDSAQAIRAAVDLPLQAQCEPPDTDAWFQRLRDAGVDTLGMHLEVVDEGLRRQLLPGKSEVPMARYWDAFSAAVDVFGRGQVSTYLLAGLGDSAETLLATSERLLAMGVYPFVVPFVPISGTPLEDRPAPDAAFMRSVLEPLGRMVDEAGVRAADIKAGCGRCAACSTLSRYEAPLSA
jgi:radical SAM protein (TIGR04043 family)